MTLYSLKPGFQALLRPIIRRLAVAGVDPTYVTLAALAVSVVAGSALVLALEARWPLLLLPAALVVRLALNAVDGEVARAQKRCTRLGAVLNELEVVVSDACLYYPLALVPGIPTGLMVAAALMATLIQAAGIAGFALWGRRYEGPMANPDRAFAFGVVALLLGVGVPPGAWLELVLGLLIALLAVALANRVHGVLTGPRRAC